MPYSSIQCLSSVIYPINKTIGTAMEFVLASSNQEENDISEAALKKEVLLFEACIAFGINPEKIRSCWALEAIPFTHFSWGNTIFLNKSIYLIKI